jgi:hypothetical protein
VDELQLLRGMRAEVPEPEKARLVGIRHRVAAQAEPGTGPAPAGRDLRAFRPAASPFPAWRVAITAAGLAVMMGLGVLVAPPGDTPAPGTKAPAKPPAVVPDEPAAAARFLLAAADAVERNPAPPARPEQWIYTKDFNDYSPFGSPRKRGFRQSEVWYRVDGTRYAADFGTGRVETRRADEGEGDARTPSRLYRFLTSMPQDPAALLRYIYERDEFARLQDRRPRSKESYAFEFIGMLLRNPSIALPPKAIAALFRAIAQVPDVVMDRDVVDAAGRHGVGLSMPAHSAGGMSYELILDAGSGRYLGDRFVVVDPARLQPPHFRTDLQFRKGQTNSDNARLAAAIVDAAGQRP